MILLLLTLYGESRERFEDPQRLANVPAWYKTPFRKEGQWQPDITEDPNVPMLGIDRDGTTSSWARFGNDEYEVLIIL